MASMEIQFFQDLNQRLAECGSTGKSAVLTFLQTKTSEQTPKTALETCATQMW